MTPLHRIAECAVHTAAQGHIVTQVGPFRACLDPTTDLIWLNYVVPVWALGTLEETIEQLQRLRELFLENRRTLRFEFVDGIWPDLPEILQRFGLQLQGKMQLMTCTQDALQPYAPPSVEVIPIPADDAQARHIFVDVQRRAFGMPDGPTPEEDIQLRHQIENGFWVPVYARLNGEPAGSGMLVPSGATAELAGVGTLPEARRQGVASAVNSWLLQYHFASGGDLVWLTALTEEAKAAYRRIGFLEAGVQWHYIDPPATE